MGGKRQNGTEETRSKSTAERLAAEPVPKRQRVSRACDQCRAAREKCDGIQPLCFPCASQNRQCSWEEPKKKRGVQTGYIRTLEMALGWIFDKMPESEKALHSLLTHEGGQGRLLLAGKDTSTGTRLHRRWRKSTVHAEIERVLSGDAACIGPVNGSTPGEDSDEEGPEKETQDTKSTPGILEPLVHSKMDGESTERPQQRPQWREDLTTPKSNETNNFKSLSNVPTPSRPRPPPNTFTLPSNHWRLLDIYFSYTHIWFPILEKHALLKTGYSYPEDGLHVTCDTAGSAGHAELWAALALTSYQEAASRSKENAREALANPGHLKPKEIYRIARSLIPLEDGDFEIRHINALLLLTLVNMACDDINCAWLLIGVASRVALSLRLHENLASTRHKQYTHTYMGCFILDTLLSARLGLVPHLRSGMAHINLPHLDNDLDEWQPWMPCPDFGPAKRDPRLSRTPSHSISSFAILHRIHLVLSRQLWDEHRNSMQFGDALLHTLHNAVSQCGAQTVFSSYIFTGEYVTNQLPSVHILRIPYLYTASMCQRSPFLHRSVLSCTEEYINSFGICGLSPLLPVFMRLVDQQTQNDSLTRDERCRWKQTKTAIEAVWTKSSRSYEIGTGAEDVHPAHYPQQPNTAFGVVRSVESHRPPSSTTTSYHPNANINHGSTNLGMLYPQDPAAKMIGLTAHHHQPSDTKALQLNGHSNVLGEFENVDTLTISPSIHPQETGRPSFDSPALDYDTILDDIASIERTSMPESETQFMANLGLRPGTNFADVFSHEFMGFT
ncbi:fungal-specific transcription factor domain-containing protein [Xylaria bambusicola]|uniref:fungal-specific transcription factor domain-containing protein n=1 Tax=Xylaria bambusicola TaxID=326684 RepID=UPI002007FE63|nr:fungal-specific transcription factor domain-containing protein [Xylaria bambusicola]KAI0506678.1 fungal-specific transcription factor domain-containing protein [Xylaria bambusicola]